VLVVGGWPYDRYYHAYLTPTPAGFVDPLLRAGYAVYEVFTGSCWGTTTVTPSGRGGIGREAITEVLAEAEADGCNVSNGANLFGQSHGGCVVTNWAWRNPDDVNAVFLHLPGIDLAYLYDHNSVVTGWGLPNVQDSLEAAHGGTDRASWLPLAADYDPVRNAEEYAELGPKTHVFLHEGDEIVDVESTSEWATEVGAKLTVADGGSHIFPYSEPEWNDDIVLGWFRSQQ
jgi:pimeloyl-ACP methyl ester carboxylesterase